MKEISLEKELLWLGANNIDRAKKHRAVTQEIQKEITLRYDKVVDEVYSETVQNWFAE